MIKTILGVTGASMLGQVIAMGLLVVIARLYSQEEFGAYGYAVSVAGLLSFLVSFRVDLLSVRLAKPLLDIIIPPLILIVFFLCVVLCVLLNVAGVESAIFLSLLAFGTFIFNFMTVLLSRVGDFRRVAFTRFLKPVITSSSQASLGVFSSNGLLIGGVLGGILPAIIVLSLLGRFFESLARRTLICLWVLKRRYRQIIEFVVQTFFNNLFINSAIIYYYLTEDYAMAGLIAILERCLKNPVAMLGASVRNYAFSKVYEDYQVGFYAKILKFNLIMALLVLVAGATAYLLGFFELVLGSDWDLPVSEFFLYLIFSSLSLINSVNGPYVIRNGLTNKIMKLDVFGVLLVAGLGWWADDFLLVFVLSYALYCLLNWIVVKGSLVESETGGCE